MPDETQLIYLEPDDEITTVVRRLREADAPRLVLVASGRTKATTSAVALRLLAQVAAEEGRGIVLVADAAARALAAEAGIPAFASVADANAEGAVPAPAQPPAAAPIHVLRGEEAPAIVDERPTSVPARPVAARGMEETQAVPLPPPQVAAPRPHPRRPTPVRDRRPRESRQGIPTVALVVLLALLAAMGVAIGTVLPAASINIQRRPVAIGPLDYPVTPDVQAADGPTLESTQQGEATGQRIRLTAATGAVLLINYSDGDVLVPAGTVVSANSQILFQTTQGVTVPDANFFFPGTAETSIEAVEPGLSGNVDSLAIDRIEDKEVDRALRGPGPDQRRIRNDDPTGGGDDKELLVVRRADVLRVKNAIRRDLEEQLAAAREGTADRIYASGDEPEPEIPVPSDLVGHASEGPFTFELTGRLADEGRYVLRPDAEAAARAQLLADPEAIPEGATITPASIEVEIGEATLDGDTMTVATVVRAEATPDVNEEALRATVAGLTADEAEAALASMGQSHVELWPFWVDRVPQLGWRISIDVQSADASS